MQIELGPVLGFRQASDASWSVCALFVLSAVDLVPELQWKVGDTVNASSGKLTKDFKGQKIVVYDFTVPRTREDQVCQYGFDLDYRFTVPGTATSLRFAYASCNGFSSLKELKKVSDKNERWRNLGEVHGAKPFHLLLMGGDQVYADTIWEAVRPLGNWVEMAKEKRLKAQFTKAMQAQTEAFYFNLYVSRWSQPEVAHAMASIPTVMMWDDHDIFDGWGSYEPSMQSCPVYQGIFAAAKEHFHLFQQRGGADLRQPSRIPGQETYSWGFQIGDAAVAALDMRSERTQTQVLSSASWEAFYSWLDSLPLCSHLLLLSSIPVVYPDFELMEDLLGLLPGQQELEDDLKDHWSSRSHRLERLRLIHRLFRHGESRRCRITILSGDVHVAANGTVESSRISADVPNANAINQLISSAMVHPAPPAVALFFLKRIAKEREQIDRGITAEMQTFPGTDHRFIGARNWLSLQFDSNKRIWAEWHFEGERTPYSKVIHSCLQ